MCFFPSHSALMQLLKARRERFMLAPSTDRSVRWSVASARSDPAKSIKDNLPTRDTTPNSCCILYSATTCTTSPHAVSLWSLSMNHIIQFTCIRGWMLLTRISSNLSWRWAPARICWKSSIESYQYYQRRSEFNKVGLISPYYHVDLCLTRTCRMAWDREEVSLMRVGSVVLFRLPLCSSVMIWTLHNPNKKSKLSE